MGAVLASTGPLPCLRRVHYLAVLAVVILGMRWAQYLWPTSPTLKGQVVAIWLMYVGFVLVGLAWLLNSQRSSAAPLLRWFLGLLGLSWVGLMTISRVHSDSYNYTAYLVPVIILLIWLKPPTSRQAWTAMGAAGWSIVVMLVTTRLLEMLGVLQVRDVPDWIDRFDRDRYWLPLSDVMGIDGRWPGPFGHNGHTAMAGALLIVIAVAQWRRFSSPVFVVVGVFTLLLINGRASIGAAFVGIAIMVLFSRQAFLARIPTWLRLTAVAGGVLVLALALLQGAAGFTGRNSIWPAFFELWQTSPVIGVGTTGIEESTGLTLQFGHAHNLYLDVLTRQGFLGFTLVLAMLSLGTYIAFRAAVRGSAGPLAIVAAYLVLNLTEPRNDWIHPSVTGLIFLLSVLVASACVTERRAVPSGVGEASSGTTCQEAKSRNSWTRGVSRESSSSSLG